MLRTILKVSKKSLPFSAAFLACIGAAPALAEWQPTKAVEIVVPAGAGGASDQMARMIQGIVVKHQLMKQPIIVVNKSGASGAEGIMDVKDAKGDPHKLMVAFSAIYTLPVAVGLPFNWRDLNPVAMIALDEFLLWVNSETSYKTPKEYLAAVKAAVPGTFKMGGTGSKREDHIITVALDKINGSKFTYIPYKSGGEAATQLVGKHIDSNVNNPSENIAQWRAGQVRALCVFSENHMVYKEKITKDQSWADIPTCRESGVDVVYQMLRGFFLPSGTSKDQVAFYADLLKKVVATPEWKDYLAKQALKDTYLTGADYVKFLEQDEAFHNKLMNEAGFAHKK
ncbi:MAG: tripartite tricarboxylate transporter substrate binding protein [Proteobacteria bacterium]|nr:tripartite tricarboxylate transporter substrate binding protein [Pseudomonadota bacterium]